ncbi:MAG: molybdopterin molybdotransferase [Flavobacteriales bacterium]|jgi:molybdopterin molybdotransferase
MITVQEALDIIEENTCLLPSITIPITQALGYVTASNSKAPISMPPFRQSSMDGYALKLSTTDTYAVLGEVQAGSTQTIALQEGEAVRIFTGAPVPETADTVVMQEHTTVDEDTITLTKRPEIHSNVRPLGEQLKEGEIALSKGTLLNAAGLGFLAGLGIAEVSVYQKPRVSILLTGDELQQPGTPLRYGQVYDSNSVTLKGALDTMGISKINIDYVPDNYQATLDCIKEHLANADVVLISGGISVGDYDFVKEALIENGVTEHFYKVNQKPGKPLWFGKKGATTVFALPGNPASSLTCFYVYVLPALRKMMGYNNTHLQKNTAHITLDFTNRFGKTLFLKGTVTDGQATPLLGQASSMLKSFALSNALLVIPETVGEIKKGETISYLDLNG